MGLNLNPARITIASWEAASVVVDARIRQPLGYDPEDPDDSSDVDELVSELEDIIDENGGLPSKTTGQIYTIEAFESSPAARKDVEASQTKGKKLESVTSDASSSTSS